MSLAIIFLSSCANKKNIVYFQQKIDNINSSSYLSESIQKNDILNINVSALDITSIAPFLENNSTTNNNADQRLIDGYKVKHVTLTCLIDREALIRGKGGQICQN